MFGFRRWSQAVLLMLGIWSVALRGATPALTTIQDVLYRADGTRFNGTVFISWNSFQAGDSSQVATHDLTVPIVDGVLRVQLVPTTNASAGASYAVKYNSKGKIQFAESWAVPPSNTPLRVKDVRTSTGTVVGPPPILTQIQLTDVTGLTNELAIRPSKGLGFAPSRTAVLNTAGQIEAASGNLSDCIRVDGTSGPCGGSGGVLPIFVDSETPAGLINGSNTTFTLNYAPSPAASLALYRNGIIMKQAIDYTSTGNTITFFTVSTPQAGDQLLASYRYADPSNPLGSFTAPQVICSSTGQSTSATALTRLGTCTIAADLLIPGDRIEVRFNYSHEGSSTGFASEVHWGSTTIYSRSAGAGESAVTGRGDVAVNPSANQWSLQSWGATLTFSAGLGIANDSTSLPITVGFFGQMSGAGSDTVTLRNFAVVRYPAQTNP